MPPNSLHLPSIPIDKRGRAKLPRAKTHRKTRKPTRREQRQAIYATWPRCPADCATCCANGWDVFVVLDRKSNKTESIGNERGIERGAKSHAQQRAVFDALGARARRPRLPVVVLLTRTTKRKSTMDRHAEWHKHVVDAVSDWLGVDDASPLVTWQFAHATGAQVGVRIQVKARTSAMEQSFADAERWVRVASGW